MKSASGKRPPDEAHGPGEEAIRHQTAAAMPGGVAKRGCTRARCSTSGSRDYADSNDNACDARHGALVVQIARCSASTSKNCKLSLLLHSSEFKNPAEVRQHVRMFAAGSLFSK